MKARPWIWLIIANLLFIGGIITLVTIAVRNKAAEVTIESPAAHAGHGH